MVKLINRIRGFQVYQVRLRERMLNRSASLAMSTSALEALPSKLDIKRHSPCVLYIYGPCLMTGMATMPMLSETASNSSSPEITGL